MSSVSTMPTNMDFRTNSQIFEQENAGVPTRMPATAILTINTADERRTDAENYTIAPYNPNRILINKQRNVIEGFFTRLALTEININWNTPNVIAAPGYANNTLTLQRGNALGPGPVIDEKIIEVDENFFSPIQLAQALTQLLNFGAGTFGSTSWDVQYTDKFASFTIVENTLDIPFRIKVDNRGQKDDLCNLMGLSGAPSTFHKIIQGGFAPMCYTPYVDIISNQLTKKQNVRDAGTNITTGNALLHRLYLNQDDFTIRFDKSLPTPQLNVDTNILGCRPFVYHKEFQVPKQIFWDTKEFINVIDIELRDYKGRVLYSSVEGIPLDPDPLGNIGYCKNFTDYQLTIQITET
jgi:hypothetical protein